MEWIGDQLSSLVSEFPANASQRKRLQSSGMLTKAQLLVFFREANALQDRREVKTKLRDTHDKGEDVEEQIARLQKLVFESQGIEGSFGISCLGKVHDKYSGDSELMQAFVQYINREEQAVEEAEMLPEAFQQKQIVKQRAEARSKQLFDEMNRLPSEDREAFVQKQEEACKQLQEALVRVPGKGQSMSESDQQHFFESLTRRTP